MARCHLRAEGDVAAHVVEDLIDGGRRRVRRSLSFSGSEVRGDRDRVEAAAHVLGDPLRHPRSRRLAGGHSHDAIGLTDEDIAPDIHIASRFTTGELPIREARIFRQPDLIGDPGSSLEARRGVPNFVRPFDVRGQTRFEVLADVDREVADEVVVGHVRHVEPRIGIQLVRELHHVLDRDAIRKLPAAAVCRRLPRITRIATIGPSANVGRDRLLSLHEADDAEVIEPLLIERMERREVGPRSPTLAGKALPVVVRHPDVHVAERVGRAHRVDAEINPAIGRRQVEQREIVPVRRDTA